MKAAGPNDDTTMPMQTTSSLILVLALVGSVALVGCGPPQAECGPLLDAMKKTGETFDGPIYDEEGAKKKAADGETAVAAVAAAPVKHKQLKQAQDKYVDRARRLATKLREWKKGNGAEDVTTRQIQSLVEDARTAHDEAQTICTKK